jgi:hypothetical protein
MSIKDLQKDIRKHQGYILSNGTCNLQHLLPKAYDLIKGYNLRTALPKDIEEVFTGVPSFIEQYHGRSVVRDDEGASYVWNESVYNYFNDIAPKGYYFGASEGDGACLGWFKCDEDY